MGDYIKLQLLNNQFSKPILQNPLFSFEARVKDGVIISQTATYKNIKVLVKDHETIISGSLHKFWNPNGSNSNDFPMRALRLAIIDLSLLFGFSPDDAIILGLEYGVNVVPDASVSEIISRTICYDWREPFESMKGMIGAGNGKDAELANYRIKIYDKGLQYGMFEPLLRFECKTKRSIDLKDTGAHTLWDLTNSEVLQLMGQKLVSRFESILFHERLDETVMSFKEQLFYHDAANPYFWQELKPWKRNDNKAKFAKLLETYGGGSLKSNLRKQIADKWEELQKCNDFAWSLENISEENRNVFAPFNEAELTAAKLDNSNDCALLKGENVTSHWESAEENPVQEPTGKSVIAEATPPCADLVKIVPDRPRRQQGSNQLQIDWTASGRPAGSDRLTGEVPTQESIPPAEEVSNRRRRKNRNIQLQIDWSGSDQSTDSRRPAKEVPTQKSIPPAEKVTDRRRRKNRNIQLQIDWSGSDQPTDSGRPAKEVPTQKSIPPAEKVTDRRRQPWKDLTKTERSDRPVSNQLITQKEQLTERDEYPQGKESVITLYLADEVEEEEIEPNEVLSSDRRMSTVEKYKNYPSSVLVLLLKKANQEKRRRYRSAGKIYNDFKLKKLLSGRQVK
jgi:hypothetical protein